jgi:creatinine amidohydrolase
VPEIEVRALTDLTALGALAQLGADEHDVPVGEGGLHAGEWETSMLEAIHPELVRRDRAEAGFTGDVDEALAAIFDQGVHAISPNGVIGDPAKASAEHGARYWDKALSIALCEGFR